LHPYRLKGKRYENINRRVKNEVIQSRKTSTATFRLETGHDCLNKHLNKTGISSTDKCTLCILWMGTISYAADGWIQRNREEEMYQDSMGKLDD
jgi:uncharacterized protein YgiM (DUF1202 family)